MNSQQKFDELFGNVPSLPTIREILIDLFSNVGELNNIIDNGIEQVSFMEGFVENTKYEITGELLELHNKGLLDIFNAKECPLFPNLYLICMQTAYFIESDIRDVENYSFSALYEKTIHIKRNSATNYKGKNINPHTFKIEHPMDLLNKAKLPLAQIQSILYNPLYTSHYLEENVKKLLEIYNSPEDKTEMLGKIFYEISEDFLTVMGANRVYSAVRIICDTMPLANVLEFLESNKGHIEILKRFIPEQINLFVTMVYLNA